MYAHVTLDKYGKIIMATFPSLRKKLPKSRRWADTSASVQKTIPNPSISKHNINRSSIVTEIEAVNAIWKALTTQRYSSQKLSFRNGKLFGVPFSREGFIKVESWNYMLPSGAIELAYKFKVHHKLVSWYYLQLLTRRELRINNFVLLQG